MGSRRRDWVAAMRDLVGVHLPGYRVDSVVRVGEGTDNLVFEVDGRLIVRWSKDHFYGLAFRRLSFDAHDRLKKFVTIASRSLE